MAFMEDPFQGGEVFGQGPSDQYRLNHFANLSMAFNGVAAAGNYPSHPSFDNPALQHRMPMANYMLSAGSALHGTGSSGPFHPAGDQSATMALNRVTDNTMSEIPFEDSTSRYGPTSYAVIRIRNIPYNITRTEISHFLGHQTAQSLITGHVQGTPIHVIMERSTAKTMDAYVEFQTVAAAQAFIVRHENQTAGGGSGSRNSGRLGSRHVIVELSNQDELLKEMWPRAKQVVWHDGVPKVLKPGEKGYKEDPFSDGFKAFFTQEEMVGMIRHAEVPQRSPFSIKCLQRTYECMISSLYKFPWHAQHMFTLSDRNTLFQTYMSQLVCLVNKVDQNDTVGLDHKLLMDFIFSGMNCPGFGERQKLEVVNNAGPWGAGVSVSLFAMNWPFDVLGRSGDSTDDQLKFFLSLVSTGTASLSITSSNDLPVREDLRQYFQVFRRPNFNFESGFDTLFSFTASAAKLSYSTVMVVETMLCHALLEVGYQKHLSSGGAVIQSLENMLIEKTSWLSQENPTDQHAKQVETGSPKAAVTSREPKLVTIGASQPEKSTLAENVQMLQLQQREVEKAEAFSPEALSRAISAAQLDDSGDDDASDISPTHVPKRRAAPMTDPFGSSEKNTPSTRTNSSGSAFGNAPLFHPASCTAFSISSLSAQRQRQLSEPLPAAPFSASRGSESAAGIRVLPAADHSYMAYTLHGAGAIDAPSQAFAFAHAGSGSNMHVFGPARRGNSAIDIRRPDGSPVVFQPGSGSVGSSGSGSIGSSIGSGIVDAVPHQRPNNHATGGSRHSGLVFTAGAAAPPPAPPPHIGADEGIVAKAREKGLSTQC